MDLSNENIVHVKKDGIEYLQFRRLLEFKNLVHAYTLGVSAWQSTFVEMNRNL